MNLQSLQGFGRSVWTTLTTLIQELSWALAYSSCVDADGQINDRQHQYLHLLSAIEHLRQGTNQGVFDAYLDRIDQADPEILAAAMKEMGCIPAEIEGWRRQHGVATSLPTTH